MTHAAHGGTARSVEHAVIARYRLTDDGFGGPGDRAAVRAAQHLLTEAIERAGVGAFDGNEFGGGEVMLFAYGPDADALFAVMEPVLRDLPFRPGNAVFGACVVLADVGGDGGVLLVVGAMIGAVQREVAQGGELGFDPVQPGSVGRQEDELDVVGRGPGQDVRVFVRGKGVQYDVQLLPGQRARRALSRERNSRQRLRWRMR
jgi:hypothetical protein